MMSEMQDFPAGFQAPHRLAGLPEDTPILVGFSGGADSHSLLHMLRRLSQTTGAPLYAAHVHHGIRGEEADRDEEFCRRTAEALGVRFFVTHADVPTLAKEHKTSIETEARAVRYAFFDRLMREHDIPLLVTAHNADDNLETVLFHLARGTGLPGLCGIPISRRFADGVLVRPLLGVSRAEILRYCTQHALTYVCDSTNTDTDYTRNRIRSEIVPALCAIHPQAVANSARTCETLRTDELCLQSMTDWFLEELREDGSLEIEKINGSPSAIVNRALMALFADVSEGGSLEYTHVQALRRLCENGRPHARLSLPNQTEAVLENGRLFFEKKRKISAPEPYEIQLQSGVNRVSQTQSQIIIENSHKPINIYKNSILLSIDSAKINGVLYARNRQAGDRIRLGNCGKSLKKLYCEKKIAPTLRQRLPVICDGDGILAVPLVGIRDGAKATADTERPLLIRLILSPCSAESEPTVTSYAEEPDEKEQL